MSLKEKPVEPTYSIVEVHQSNLAPPDPEEATNTQHATKEVVQVGVNEVATCIVSQF